MVLLRNFPPPDEGIQLKQENTSVNIDGKDLGNGTLFITESCVAWQKGEDGKGFSLQYPAISCHAISRDLSAFPHECLYLMIDGKLPGSDLEEEDSDEEDDDDEDSEADLSEIRIVPEDKNMLEAMFAAVSDCQVLHPDPEDIDSEDEAFADYEELEEDAQENGYLHSEEGAAAASGGEGESQLDHFSSVLQLGQGDAASSSSGLQHMVSPSGGAGPPGAEEEGEVELMDSAEPSQFQDAEEME